MNQEAIINPNRSLALSNYGRFRNDSREVIGIMRNLGVDKSVRDKMRVFLADAEKSMKINRKAMQKELTKSGHPTFVYTMMPETIGAYYPDDIPVDTYMKMKQDPQVSLGLAIIKMPLMSLKWVIECEDKDIAAFVTEAISMIWRKLLKSMLTAIEFGFASHEKVWWMFPMDVHSTTAAGRKKTHFKGKAEVYKKVKAHYPSTIRIRTDGNTGDFLGIVQDIGGGSVVSLDRDKCFLFSLEDDFGNYFGGSRLKQAYKPWYWKEVLYQFMLRYYERRGSPPTIVTYPMGVNIDPSGNEVDNCTIALRVGQSLIENSVVTLPYEETKDGRSNQWQVDYLKDEKRGEMFIDCITHLETQILRGLLVPERVVTQDISTGSYSMAATHAEAFLLAQEGLTSTIEDAVNDQLIPPLVEFNFKPKERISCRLQLEGIQHDRKRLLKEIFIAIINNINTFAKMGQIPNVLPSIVEMAKVLKVPLQPFSEEYVSGEEVGLLETTGDKARGKGGDDKVTKEEVAESKKVIPIKKKTASVKRYPITL